ncbi:MAG: extracellular solute-binding protein [Anaerolineae bacterium]|jgi:ABC-type glycerol-3-phosphate transport system substrate-binding protein|nr:extracellular solute-binding protein [Anaerolineae bacterium]
MSGKLSRRNLLKLTAVSAAALGANLVPVMRIFAQGNPVTLRFQENAENYAAVVAAFNEQFPNITIEFVNVTGVDHAEIASKILSQLAAGQPVNIGYAATEATQLYAGEGLAMPLTQRALADQATLAEYFADVSPTLIEGMMYEGDLYQLPRDFNAAHIYFNKALLAEAGLEVPGDEWTKDDFVEYARAMTGIGGGDSFGYGWTNRLWGSWTPWFFVNDTNLLAEERAPGGEAIWDTFYAGDPLAEGRGGGWRWPAPQANNPKMVEALDFVVSLTTDGLTPAVEIGGGDRLQGFFTSGKLGMTIAGGFWAGALINAGMEPGSFEVQFWPKWVSQRHQFGTGGAWILQGAGTEAEDASWEFVKFNAARDIMLLIPWMANASTTPVRRSINTPEYWGQTGLENGHVFYDALDQRPDTAPIPAPVFSIEMTNIYTRYTSLATSGEQTPQAALDGMQAELEQLYARNA